LVGQPSGAMLK